VEGDPLIRAAEEPELRLHAVDPEVNDRLDRPLCVVRDLEAPFLDVCDRRIKRSHAPTPQGTPEQLQFGPGVQLVRDFGLHDETWRLLNPRRRVREPD